MLNRDPGKIVIIGSGVGGLTAGIILAKLGHAVTIVEKNAEAGGLMRGYRRHGYDCPVGVHYLGALSSGQPLRRLWDYLGVSSAIPLERMGVNGPIDRYVYDDFIFDLPEGLDAFAENLNRAFPVESAAIKSIMQELREACENFMRLEMLMSAAEINISPESFMPMGNYLDHPGCSARLASVLGVPATLIGVPLRDCPVFYYNMILASYLISSWRLVGGSSPMAEAFIRRFQALGGELVTGDGVDRIRAAGSVTGVGLTSGRKITAETVIAAVHPQTVKAMLPPETLRPGHGERIDGFQNTRGLVVVTATIDGKVHPILPYNLYRLYPEADGSLHRGFFIQVRDSGRPDTRLLSMMATSHINEWQTWLNTRSGARGEEYEQRKLAVAEWFLAEADKLIGPLQGLEVIDVYTPLTIRDWVGSPEGSAYGIMRSSAQLMKTAFLNRPSLDGLYFAGQNILAPGIMGTTLGSFQAARRVIGRERFRQEVLEALP